ncbi:unnamed protein product [Peronospora belbahrii]|uniref:DNA repair protein n=1 Tax=Peronospora belbahrii TaxID=622444 RepID=A0ABN8D6X4_9STRA|nr:unnamed protein product [Peronospora belbahrii]
MGVQNLWVLLAPVGRQVEIESLAGQVLAVDASIWLTQFIKAMRDDEGRMIPNAHLLGTLHRVAKLLYYQIRPVFVFDGQTPEIKKRTTARRRKRQEQQTANLRHTAERLLLNRLKQQRQEMKKKTGGGGDPVRAAVAPGFTLPGTKRKKEDDEVIRRDHIQDDDEEEESERRKKNETIQQKEKLDTINSVQGLEETAVVEQKAKNEDLTLDDIDLDTARLSKIDLHAVFSLPPHLQKDMIQKILRDRRQKVRDQFIPLAGNPEKYSHTQISSFLQTSALNRRIEAVKRQKREEEMKHQGGVGQGHRIDSNSNRFYIYQRDTDNNKETDQQDEDVVADVDCTDMAERAATIESMQPNDAQVGALKSVKEQSLSKFSSGQPELASDDNAMEATATWIARHQVRVKQEPMLAIEKLRLKRLTKAATSVKPAAPDVSVKQLPASDVSVTLNVDDVEPEEMVRFQKLLSASAAMPISTAGTKHDVDDENDEDDDVDWEEVDANTVKQPSNDIFGSGNDEQTVPKHVDTNKLSPFGKTSVLRAAKERKNEEAGSEDKLELENMKEVTAVGVTGAVSMEQKEQQLPDVDSWDERETDYKVDDAEGTEELFLTLKDEMEDAKGHEDLDLLKDEALQSAMATASNLTQWAAGAVRRALQAHSLQHGRKGEARGSSLASPREKIEAQDGCTFGVAKDSLQLLIEEKKSKSVIQRAEAIVTKEEENVTQVDVKVPDAIEDNEEQLQAALAASIANDHEELADKAGNAVRYLQYSQPNEDSEPNMLTDTTSLEMDAATLRKEQLQLKKLRNQQLRDTDGITDDMVAEVMELLRLFGVPFLVSPMEAEAQCAALEQLGLVDGVITDDSDIFPFGGQRVYKNIFHHQKFVEAFSTRDIERELGFSREQIIALALLLGSDYTDGVRGIGIVNATEIAASYPGIEGLREFKKWVHEFDVGEEAQRVASSGSTKRKKGVKKGKGDEGDDENDDETARERFQRSHASLRRKWELGDEFPSQHVVQAYMAPQVDRSDAQFSWSSPDVAALRNYCANAFGWDQQKSDGVLQPLEEKAKAAAAFGSRHIQTRLDQYFTSYDDRVHYAQVKSKRLRSAISHGSKRKKQRE